MAERASLPAAIDRAAAAAGRPTPPGAEREAEAILKLAPNDPRALADPGVGPPAAGALTPRARSSTRSPRRTPTPRSPSTSSAPCSPASAMRPRSRRFAAPRAEPRAPEAWRALGESCCASRRRPGADTAYAEHRRAQVRDPRPEPAAEALCRGSRRRGRAAAARPPWPIPTDIAAMRPARRDPCPPGPPRRCRGGGAF